MYRVVIRHQDEQRNMTVPFYGINQAIQFARSRVVLIKYCRNFYPWKDFRGWPADTISVILYQRKKKIQVFWKNPDPLFSQKNEVSGYKDSMDLYSAERFKLFFVKN